MHNRQARCSGTSGSKANKSAVVQLLQGLVQTSAETKDLNEVAEGGQGERFGNDALVVMIRQISL